MHDADMTLSWCCVTSGWGGWGDVNVHVHLHHEVDARSRQGWGWGGWGDVKFLHIERKRTSVVHSHPPSHYIRTHAFLP